MKMYMDLHTHTVASGHGYSTLKENIEAAKAVGLTYLGLSEHGPAMPGGPHPFFFSNYRCIKRDFGDLKLLCGVEANIIDFDGHLDLKDSLLEKMDYVIASMHVACVKPGTMEENTRASIMAMKNPYVKILGHPDDSRYPLDYEALVKAAKEESVALELNNSSLDPNGSRQDGVKNMTILIQTCKKYEVPVILGTDSHFCDSVGRFDEVLALLQTLDFPEHLILNTDPENIQRLANFEK